ncbi:MAG TPA: hypothetical protein VN493_10670 [Thermoanaerobaculia bacterium]|nr:hypothetical protein [Thermoanaerobaculia bacterium]
MQPARAEEVGATMYRVTVTYDGSELSFQGLIPFEITLAEGDVLILHFQGIPNDMIPGVTFSRDGDDFVSPLGPFQDALQTADLIVLRGNSGSTGLFQSRALLSPKLRGEEPPLFSTNELRIYNNELSARPAKEIRVFVRKLESGEVVVTVDLEEVALFEPDSVVWNFVYENLEQSLAYEPLLYLDAARTEVRTGPFGPFESLSVAGIFETLGDGRILGYRLITSGNDNIRGQYHFNVGVRPTRKGEFRELLSVVDPIIDNSGPPNPAV